MKRTKNITGNGILVSDLRRCHRTVRREVEGVLKRVLGRGWYVLGRELAAFEEEFAAYCGASYAAGVASGTEALQLALMVLSIGPGDEVITAVNTAIPTAMAICSAGAIPRFVDIDRSTFNIDVDSIEKAITKKTKAIIPVHLYGNPCDIEGVMRIAKAHDLRVVEDACQAHGASFKGKKVGTFGEMGAFSFYPTKNLGCYGDGGAVVTDSRRHANMLKLLRNYGQPSRYLCETKGINSRLDEIQAAVLRLKLRRLDGFNKRRVEIARLYNSYLSGIDEVRTPVSTPSGVHVYHLYVILCQKRDGLREHLRTNGVEAQIHYPVPLHLQKAFIGLGHKRGDFPVAERLSAEILSLPIFPELKDDEIKKISRLIKGFYRKPRP